MAAMDDRSRPATGLMILAGDEDGGGALQLLVEQNVATKEEEKPASVFAQPITVTAPYSVYLLPMAALFAQKGP